jgi:hypothetical protein
MNLKRTATIGVVGGALAAWLAAAATSGIRESHAPPPEHVTPIELRGAELATEIARLHDRLRPSSAPQRPGRNLFQFTAPRSRMSAAAAPALIENVSASLSPAPLKLSGIAEDPGPAGPVRTAIISGEGQLFLVKEGEMVTSRYRVATISADAVELVEILEPVEVGTAGAAGAVGGAGASPTLRLALK